MIILDTDHLSVLAFASDRVKDGLVNRMRADQEEFAITVISVEEELRGWLALIQSREIEKQVPVYTNLTSLLEFLSFWTILPFDELASQNFQNLKSQRLRMGTMDLKIAAICLAHQATLLTRNLSDFQRVDGLTTENWLDE